MDTLEAWRLWRSWLRVEGSGSGDTSRIYTKAVLGFLAETDCRPLTEYREADCADFLQAHAPRGAAKHGNAKALRSFFGWCLRHKLVAVDPMLEIHLKKPRRVPPVTLNADELARLIESAREVLGERPAAAILLVYLLGLRRIEAVGLRWPDVIEGETGPVIEIHSTKGADQRPPIPLEPLALRCLAQLHELPRPYQSSMAPEFIIGIGRATFSGWVHRAGTEAGLHPKKVKAHRLRATLATNLLKSGVDVTVVQRILGHERLESTAWYFAQATETEMRSALNHAQDWLPPAVAG